MRRQPPTRGVVRQDDAGFAGLSELAVALLFAGMLMPLVGIGLSNGYEFLTAVTARAATSAGGGQLLAEAEAQLQGAQPLAYCTSASASAPALNAGNPAVALEVPLGQCPDPGLGPLPPSGQVSWHAYVSALPVPSTRSCGTPQLTAGALVTATATCVGFFSYDYQPSGGQGAGSGALSASGPFTPPELTYLWQCAATCPSGGPPNSLWLTYYLAPGSYTNAGCPSPDDTCSDPDWQTATSATRFIGQLASSSGLLFTYTNESGAEVALDPTLNPSGIPAADLAAILVVDVAVTWPAQPGLTAAATESVPITGNVYQSSTDGNG